MGKYGYSGYGIGFDRRTSFSFPLGGFGQNVITFVVDMSCSAHIDNNSWKRTNTRITTYINCRKKSIWLILQRQADIVASPLCLGNISEDWSVDIMKGTEFNGYVYDFSVDLDSTDVDDIKDIHKYLMKKNDIV